ncbi:uncharacterized protein LOC111041181 [Myzus persicae]|uniref:uncharacterized protein LOC111041181 n=1 Tax=Myzus persicae TaxID=13164 RepID=UPI000B932B22|nr:uncharacterized protein LOC111041181 [Myzus persicae]XP_022181085.1 uncharacterized protein LOC111041181 [Myzus persicae]
MAEIENIVKIESKEIVTISLDCAIGMIPMCKGDSDIFQFINMCELSLSIIEPKCVPILLKCITCKLSPKLFALIKYKDITKWEDIKIQLTNELKLQQLILQGELRSIKMRNDESVNSYHSRVEEMHYKICNIMNMDKPETDAKIINLVLMGQTLAFFIIGLIEPIRRKVGNSWGSLEEVKRIAEVYENEFNLNRQASGNRHKNKNGNRGI